MMDTIIIPLRGVGFQEAEAPSQPGTPEKAPSPEGAFFDIRRRQRPRRST